MSNIKSLGQSIPATQAAPAETSQRSSEIVKENKPAEFRPLSNEQKENIKQARNAENKMAESAMMAKTAGSMGGIFGRIVETIKDAKKLSEPKSDVNPDFFDPWPSNPAEYHVDKHDMEHYYEKHPAERHLSEHATEAYYAERPAEDHLRKHESQAFGNHPSGFTKSGASKDREFTKDPDSKSSNPVPTGTGPVGESQSKALNSEILLPPYEQPKAKKFFDDIQFQPPSPRYEEGPVKEARKFIPSIRIGNLGPPDDLDAREEEPITAYEPTKKKTGDH